MPRPVLSHKRGLVTHTSLTSEVGHALRSDFVDLDAYLGFTGTVSGVA